MGSLYQTVNGLVGNVDWGESLTIVACEFPGLNNCIKDSRKTSSKGRRSSNIENMSKVSNGSIEWREGSIVCIG